MHCYIAQVKKLSDLMHHILYNDLSYFTNFILFLHEKQSQMKCKILIILGLWEFGDLLSESMIMNTRSFFNCGMIMHNFFVSFSVCGSCGGMSCFMEAFCPMKLLC
jgi:hypothetical protein